MDRLRDAVAVANIPSLIPVLVQLTGDERWLEDPYRPTRARGLDDHDDGGLPPHVQEEVREASVEAIEAWLVREAGQDRAGGAEPPLRITTLPWFVHEHDEVPRGAAARPSIRSMANCAACHPGAESWDFDEDRAKIPRT